MSKVKVMKAKALYTKLYGREAYEAYMKREAEIDELMKDKGNSKSYIIGLRVANFRKMKESEGKVHVSSPKSEIASMAA